MTKTHAHQIAHIYIYAHAHTHICTRTHSDDGHGVGQPGEDGHGCMVEVATTDWVSTRTLPQGL